MHYFAGLDIGTTHTKLVITDGKLDIVFREKLGYSRGFGATLDALEIFQNIEQLLELADTTLQLSQHQITITCSAAMHSLLLVDESAKPISPVYTWADNSSQPVIRELSQDPVACELFKQTGTPIHPMSPFCKLAWLARSNPDLLDRASKCVGIKEFAWFKITGKWEIDHSMASATGLFSQKSLDWIEAALKIAGISRHKLSAPVPVTQQYTLQHMQWVIGASDGCLAQPGSGAMEKGTAALTIGTSGAIRITLEKPFFDPRQELFTYLLDESHFVCGGSSNNGGIVLEWWQDQVMEQSGETTSLVNNFLQKARQANPGCNGLVCLPYFGGERAPVWDANARGMFSGIHNSHGQPEFTLAILEGIGFSFRLLLEKLEVAGGEIERIYASGGFSLDGWWVQLMADILQKPMLVNTADADASAMGAIAIGLKVAGKISGWEAFASLLPGNNARYQPADDLKEIYLPNYLEFKRLCQFSS